MSDVAKVIQKLEVVSGRFWIMHNTEEVEILGDFTSFLVNSRMIMALDSEIRNKGYFYGYRVEHSNGERIFNFVVTYRTKERAMRALDSIRDLQTNHNRYRMEWLGQNMAEVTVGKDKVSTAPVVEVSPVKETFFQRIKQLFKAKKVK